jgi:Mg2+/Co2+ transporter CorB
MFKIISSIILTLQSSLSFLFSGAEVAMNVADSNKLTADAQKFVNGGTRSLGTCALANHLANAGFSMANGFLVGSFCGWIWGVFTTVFSLLGLWYLGELLPKVTAAKNPEKFLNTHAKKLLAAKTILAPIVERIVAEEPRCEVKEAEKELVSAARMADEEWSLAKLPMYEKRRHKDLTCKVVQIANINSVESILTEIAISERDELIEYKLVNSRTLEFVGYFTVFTIVRWMMDHKN